MSGHENLIRFSVTVPKNLLNEFENNSEKNNRSEALRDLMREYISRERWKFNDGILYATITIIYDHHLPELSRNLTAVQHDFGKIIICSTHVHLNHETCLECLITKGLASDIKNCIETLKKVRGIKNLNFSVTTEL